MLRGLARHRTGVAGLVLLVVIGLGGAAAPLLSPTPPTEQVLAEGLAGPTAAHPFGQDRLGRDVMSRVLYGARISMLVAVIVVGVSALIGLAVGGIAGYAGGLLDEAVMRVIDILQAFPGILLAIALASILGPSLQHVIVALTVIWWVGFARLTRGQVLLAREMEFVAAARALGMSRGRLLARHLIPNILAPITVEASFGMAAAIMAEASLSFLGLGVEPPTPSWGAMLNEARQYLVVAPHLVLFPGLTIMATVLAFNFVGDALRDILDPRSRP
ncbi:MAG: ABC transporter permease [Candidatus Methylomirabilales bacterium]